MAIFILEDQLVQAHYLTEIIQSMMRERNMSHAIYTHYRESDVIASAKKSLEPNIYFLDIQIKSNQQAGLEVAQAIRQFDSEGLIVFVTTHSELALTSYQYMVSALSFIDKNTSATRFYEQVAKCLDYFQQHIPQEVEDVFELQTKYHYVKVRWQELYYFEVVGNHLIRLVAHNRTVDYYGTLNEITEIDDRLIRVHQAFVVNVHQVKYVDKKHRVIHLHNGASIPVSRTYYRAFCGRLERSPS